MKKVLFGKENYLKLTIDRILLDVYVFFINSSSHPNTLNAYARLAFKMLFIHIKDEIFNNSSLLDAFLPLGSQCQNFSYLQ